MDPVRDLDIINEELRLKDEEAFNKVYDELAKKYERGEKKLKLEYVRHTKETWFCQVTQQNSINP